jgi:very-long-chain enoyl-CoA reductase
MELKIINQTSKKKDKLEETSLVCNLSDKVIDLKKMIINLLGLKLTESRVGLFLQESEVKKTLLSNDNKTLRDFNVNNYMTIIVKDLGPQIGWRTVYVIEYLGPLLLTLYFFLIHLGAGKSNTSQKLGFLMATFHYAKRIFESIYIHEFSISTMPLKNLFKNCAYYWGVYGFFCSYFLFNKNYQEPGYNTLIQVILTFFFFSAEIKNLKCHLILKNLKEKNQGQKGIPNGEGFEFVSCANYFWEFLSWVFFSLLVNSIPFYIFTGLGFYQMREWAIKKHKQYLKDFADRYPKNRKAFIPFLI